MRLRARVGLSSTVLLLLASGAPAVHADPVGPAFTVRPGTTQLAVLGATPGAQLELLGPGGPVGTGTVDSQGSLLWRRLAPGSYTVGQVDPAGLPSAPAQVTAYDAPPPSQDFYDSQHVGPGFGYLTTRDGTTLSVDVVLPGDPADGPFPTLVEYSGYDPSNPGNTTMPQLANALGFAYVGVNIRGTGCSGGSFLPFEPVQSLDGYDAIEAIAAQPWVEHHHVGMFGVSYPGISQLYVARTQPPHLASIAPMSVIDDTYRGTLYPGGILNTGFAVPWAAERASSAAPYGQGWTQARADGGDTDCADNQLLRLQNPDPLALIESHPFYEDDYFAQIDPTAFAPEIDVPVFIAGTWQDEQTGGHFPDFLDQLTGSPHVYAHLTNGAHVESLASLGIFGRFVDFLDLYVAQRKPTGIASFVGPSVASLLTGVDHLRLPRGLDYTGLDYAGAKALYEAQEPVRVLFEEGAAAGSPRGAPVPRFVRSFASWPVPGVEPRRFYLSGTALGSRRPDGTAARGFTADPGSQPARTWTGSSSGLWGPHPGYDWRQVRKGQGLAWISRPLRSDLVAVGTGSVDVWIRSSADDVDLEATLSEVRPDGTEVYVQSGWLRASHRALDRDRSTPVRPVHTDREADAAALPAGEWTRVRIELFPFAHPFREGSRVRLTLDAPGGARPLWAFADTVDDGQRVSVSSTRARISRLTLSQVPGLAVPRTAPPCAALRSQPCRHYGG